MSPEEHYAEAERLLAGAQNVMDVAPIDGLTREECAVMAQVHATLALYRQPTRIVMPGFLPDEPVSGGDR